MNLDNLKKNGARKALVEEAAHIRAMLEDKEAQLKWYDAERLANDLQVLYAELLADAQTK